MTRKELTSLAKELKAELKVAGINSRTQLETTRVAHRDQINVLVYRADLATARGVLAHHGTLAYVCWDADEALVNLKN